MKEIKFSTTKKFQSIDITDRVQHSVLKTCKEGMCLVYAPHATAAITINENYDPKICDDLFEALSTLIPSGKWRHDRIDGNGAAHIKSAIIGPSETIPVKDGKLQLGDWQSVQFLELDGPRKERKVLVSVHQNI